MNLKILAATGLALCFFAANSVLCRLALGDGYSDPYSFSALRLVSGATTLVILYVAIQFCSRAPHSSPRRLWQSLTSAGTWLGGLSLFTYALSFSWAYLELETGTGALLLFGAVQITLIVSSVWRGNGLRPMEWLGLLIAFSGLIFLVAPNLQTPAWKALLAMSLSGLAWGVYTLLGQQTSSPLATTMGNFVRSLPLCGVLMAVVFSYAHMTSKGAFLAVLSGAVASGLGYAIWYTALNGLSPIQAGVVQLLVPILAAIGGALFVSEPIEFRLMVASFWVLGGIFVVLLAKNNNVKKFSR